MSLRRRFDAVETIRAFATRVDKMRFRDAGQYVEAMSELAADMRKAANEAMRHDDPPETSVFGFGSRIQSASGREIPIERRARRNRARGAVTGRTSATPLSLAEQVFGPAKATA
jgi:ribosomal protein L34